MDQGDSEIYNLGADSKISIIDAAKKFCEVANSLGHKTQIVHLEPRDEVHVAYCDHTKAKQHLGFKDETKFEDLIAEMFAWAASQPNHPVKMMKYEVDKKMYGFWKA